MPLARMHADEIDTDVSLVRRLVAGQFPAWSGLSVAPVPSAGTDNALYRLGRDMVVRLPRIHWAVDAVAREQRWLPRLAPHLPVAIPAPLGLGWPAAGYPYPWSVYRWIQGVNPVVGRLRDPVILGREVAGFIAAMRMIDRAGAPPAGRCESLRARDDEVRRAMAALDGLIDASTVAAAWETALAAPAWAGEPVWIHGDLAPGNLLCRGGRLAAVIDFGGIGLGDPAADLPVGWNLLPATARDAFRALVGIDDATWERGRGWALSIALIQLPYYRRTNPTLAASARRVISEVLLEHTSRT